MSKVSMISFLVISSALFGLAGCATTSIRKVEATSNFHSDQIKRVLVINMSPDPQVRAQVEGEFVRQWKKKDVEVAASHQVLPAGTKLEKAPVAAAARELKFDTVLVTRLIATQKIDRDIPEDSFEPVTAPGAGGKTEYTQAIVASPQYASNYRMAAVTTRVYKVETEERIWTAVTETLVAEEVSKLIKPFVKTVLEALYSPPKER